MNIIITPLLLFLLFNIVGCSATNNIQKIVNEGFIENKKPVRLIKTYSDKNVEIYNESWAGTKGLSVLEGVKFKYELLDSVTKKCGYGLPELIETRVVSHNKLTWKEAWRAKVESPITWEEVWLFKDPKSFRKDKISGLTMLIMRLPSENRPYFEAYGDCHTGLGTSYSFHK